MRYLIYLIILVVLAVGSAIAAQIYLNEPVIIRYGEWSAAPPLSLALGGAIMLIIALLLVVRLLLLVLFLPLRLREWGRNRRHQKQSRLRTDAIQQLAYGNRRSLMKTFAELASVDAAAAWQAAQMAQEAGDGRAKNKYLQQAAGAKDAVISAAAKAKLCMQDNRLTEADNILKSAGAPRTAALLAKLYYDVSIERADYRAALTAAICLRDESSALYGTLVGEATQRCIETAKTAADISAFWREVVPAAEKKKPDLLAMYLAGLWRLGDEKTAAEGLTQAIKQYPSSSDILRLVVSHGTAAQCETALKANEKHADGSGAKDVELLQCLAALADKMQLPGKSRQYSQMVAALKGQHAT